MDEYMTELQEVLAILEKQGEILELVENQQTEIEHLQLENRELTSIRQQNLELIGLVERLNGEIAMLSKQNQILQRQIAELQNLKSRF